MNRIKGKSLSEIAAIIGRSIATVSRELKREIPAIRGTGQGIKAPGKMPQTTASG
ncbi:MAG: helix-turn-helix domain-containing protein [Angelakisella sp.]|nr:helix-turn-helix domain-containing protein [Angelakisella sp.]MCI9529039.1 helix-turn-helix domain-containing protein [Angelakisella sp.]